MIIYFLIFVFILSLTFVIHDLFKKHSNKFTGITLGIILLLLLLFFWNGYPNQLRIFGDEPLLIGSAKNLELTLDKDSGILPIFGIALLFNDSVISVIKLNIILSILTLFLLFLLHKVALKNDISGIIAIIIIGTFIEFVKGATSAYTTIVAALYLVSTLIGFFTYENKTTNKMLFFVSFFLLLVSRIEFMVFIPCFLLYHLFTKKNRKYNIAFWAIFLALILPPLLRIVNSKKYLWQSVEYLSFNFSNLIINVFETSKFEIIALIFVCLNVYIFYKKKIGKDAWKKHLVVGVGGILLLIFYSFNGGFSSRYHIPIMIITSLGYGNILSIIMNSLTKSIKMQSLILLITFLGLVLIIKYSIVYDISYRQNHIITIAPELIEKNLDNNCTFYVPYVSNYEMGTNLDVKTLEDFDNTEKCKYYIRDFLCPDTKNYKCDNFEKNHDLQRVFNITLKEEEIVVFKIMD